MNNSEKSANGTVANKIQDGKKKINMWYIVIAVVVLIAAVIVTAVVISNKNKANGETSLMPSDIQTDETDEPPCEITPVSAADDVDFTFENVSREFLEELENHLETTAVTGAEKADPVTFTTAPHTTEKQTQVQTMAYVEKTTQKTQEATDTNEDVMSQIQSFFDCSFYMDGIMVSGGSETPLEMAVNGNDMHIFSEMDGTDIAILNLDGKLYLMNPASKKYIVIDAALKKMMDIDEESLTFDFMKIKFDSQSPSSVTKATFKGNDAVCYTYKSSDNCIDFIIADSEIKQIIQYSPNNEASSVITLDEFSAEIPAEMLNLKGYSKTNMISFLSDMM